MIIEGHGNCRDVYPNVPSRHATMTAPTTTLSSYIPKRFRSLVRCTLRGQSFVQVHSVNLCRNGLRMFLLSFCELSAGYGSLIEVQGLRCAVYFSLCK